MRFARVAHRRAARVSRRRGSSSRSSARTSRGSSRTTPASTSLFWGPALSSDSLQPEPRGSVRVSRGGALGEGERDALVEEERSFSDGFEREAAGEGGVQDVGARSVDRVTLHLELLRDRKL